MLQSAGFHLRMDDQPLIYRRRLTQPAPEDRGSGLDVLGLAQAAVVMVLISAGLYAVLALIHVVGLV